MKTVLCYGDSLTWGYDAETGLRHAFEDRWPNVLAKGLGASVCVVADGLNGRTTVYDDHSVPAERNGAKTLPTALTTHQPLDLVVFLLGTNDLKRATGGGRCFEARLGMERLVEIVLQFPYQRGYAVPKILIVCPPHFRETDDRDARLLLVDHGLEESQKFAAAYAMVAEEYECHHFDAAEICETTPLDGFHLDATNTRRLGEALVPVVKDVLAD
ncbi:SGNH/GDSL hydrolase family protein [Aurantimonas sp. Leaf443]|uniref:SGNH/GDSL hydrolase family protein n=1 Tax=Aurantimonas sp. Leaf443 TaxID=1736378 RepID=UPI00070007C5|nr:SGNH/GDSL hydrolase family protein [Aurantimonas sp. Leaf443]KQT83466.1 arylesterase [Aurantimonas sp. Leaf443]